MNNLCIGIISWLPDDKDLRSIRRERLQQLLTKLDFIFNVPIIVIAQNWKDNELLISKNVIVYNYNKLGITKARQKLRDKFLKSNFENIIFLDDDIDLFYSMPAWNEYKRLIENNKDKVIEYDFFLFNLLYMPRKIITKYKFLDINPENGEGYEDWAYLLLLRKKLGKDIMMINSKVLKLLNYNSRSEQANDVYSTWYHGQYDKKVMSKQTEEYIRSK